MDYKNDFEKLCQTVLRKHYRQFRQRVKDPFFVSSEASAERALNSMLRAVRIEVEESVYIDYRDKNSKRVAEIILTDYLAIGSRYGKRYYKRILKKE